MKIVTQTKEPVTIGISNLIKGGVYSNIRSPQSYWMKVSSPSYKGLIKLDDGTIVNTDIAYSDGWYEVEAEVHIK